MSKSLKNYPDPNLIIDAYGADALRLFLINSPVVRADSLRFKEEGVKDVISRVLLPFLNSYRFFLGHASLLKKESGIDFKYNPDAPKSENVMDQWILARCQSLIQHVKEEMEGECRGTVPSMYTDDMVQPTVSTPSSAGCST
jgi:isoleucyl-tRNA synthetase